MKQLQIIILLSITLIGCNNKKRNSTIDKVEQKKIEPLENVSDNEMSKLKDNTFFEQDKNGSYHYKNVKYFFDDIGLSPYSLGRLLVKETEEVKGSNESEGTSPLITIYIIDDGKNSLLNGKTFKDTSDEVNLYSHFIESITYSTADDWNNIRLFKYDDFSKAFLKSDEQYWYFNMNSDNQHISKNCYFITFEKFPNGKVCILRFSDMNGVLQEVNIKNAKENSTEIDFMYPEITFISENPFQYKYSAKQSKLCNTISISPKDYSDLRKHITKSKFKLVFYDTKENKDSLYIPIENGLLYNKPDKQFNIEIFK